MHNQELQRAKSYIRGRLALSLEDPLGLALFLTRQQLLQGRVKNVEQYLEQIDSVTAEDIQEVAKEIFASDRLNAALVGPKFNASNLQQLLKL